MVGCTDRTLNNCLYWPTLARVGSGWSEKSRIPKIARGGKSSKKENATIPLDLICLESRLGSSISLGIRIGYLDSLAYNISLSEEVRREQHAAFKANYVLTFHSITYSCSSSTTTTATIRLVLLLAMLIAPVAAAEAFPFVQLQ
jgi:hypothetical protein